MKAKVISVLLAGLFLALNINVVFAKGSKRYKNVEKNIIENTITTEIYNGEKDENLAPVRKQVVKYNENGTAAEKLIYKWDTSKGWTTDSRYCYYYDFEGNLNALEYAHWSESDEEWNAEPYLTMYVHTTEGDLLTINQ